MADLLAYIFEIEWQPNDRFILSKGHAAIGLYAALHRRGILDAETLRSYHSDGSALVAHPSHLVPGVDFSTGSLGHGPAVAIGLAFGLERRGEAGHVYCVLGDGECQEGTVWESILLAARLRPRNVTLIVDANGYQGFSNPTSELLPVSRLTAMLRATGLRVHEVDGHDFLDLHSAFENHLDGPLVIVAHTIKGKGVPFMEGRFEWHYLSLDDRQLALALEELA